MWKCFRILYVERIGKISFVKVVVGSSTDQKNTENEAWGVLSTFLWKLSLIEHDPNVSFQPHSELLDLQCDFLSIHVCMYLYIYGPLFLIKGAASPIIDQFKSLQSYLLSASQHHITFCFPKIIGAPPI